MYVWIVLMFVLFDGFFPLDDIAYHIVGRGVYGYRVTPVKYE